MVSGFIPRLSGQRGTAPGDAHVSEADESSENLTTTETAERAEREPEVEVEDSEPAMAASF